MSLFGDKLSTSINESRSSTFGVSIACLTPTELEERMKIGIGLLVILLGAGCLRSEETEIRILRAGGDPSVVVMEQINLYSDERDGAEVKKDFDQLIRDWRGEEDTVEKRVGMLAKSRELFIRDGKVVFRQTYILQNLDMSDDGIRVGDSQISWTLKDDGDEIVETNGKVLPADPRTIVWPKDAPELRFRTRQPLRQAFETSQPLMVQMVKDRLADDRK
jgi:hypothetical protein